MGPSRAITLIGEGQRSLHHRAGAAIHIILAAGNAAEVGRIGGVEQQKRGLPIGCAQVKLDASLPVLGASLEAGLTRDIRNHLRLEFQVYEFVLSGLEDLHSEGSLYRRRRRRILDIVT